jgi:hypothetical protein
MDFPEAVPTHDRPPADAGWRGEPLTQSCRLLLSQNGLAKAKLLNSHSKGLMH